MKTKKLTKIAKFMFKNSLDASGFVSGAKVKTQMQTVAKAKTQGLSRILKTYKKLVENALSKEEVIVESAVKLASLKKKEVELLEKTGAKKVTYKINPKIIFGTKITHGDWIYEETLDSKIAKLLDW